MKPAVVILSAPSGSGKTTLARALAARRADVGISVSATTRAPRGAERNGEAYHFVSRDEFQRRVDASEFLEWAEYAGERYGTLRSEVDDLRAGGRHAILDIDVQGARQVRARVPPHDVIDIFVLPPDARTWMTRLRERGTESAAALARRRETAVREIDAAEEYRHAVVNDVLDLAVREVEEILDGGGTPAHRPPDWRERIAALRREAAAWAAVEGGVT